jgi:hypothetical protein
MASMRSGHPQRVSDVQIDQHDLGITWVVADEAMRRTAHALCDDGRGWLIDPFEDEEALSRALALGETVGVLQLLDRHNRDCAALAERLGVPHLRLPDAIPDSPFEVVKVVDVPRWREIALWWPDRRALVVAEAVGTGPFFRGDEARAGIHPFLRVRPPKALRGYDPQHLLMGHGRSLHGAEAGPALRDAYARSLRDIPRTIARLPRLGG